MDLLTKSSKTEVDDDEPGGEELDPVVIFISGWSGPGIEWELSPIKLALQANDFETVRFNPHRGGRGNIHNSSKWLAVESAQYLEMGRKVFYIGHSMGGLVAKEAADIIDPHGIVSIGTPHRGTWAANLAPPWFSTSAKQMRVGSEYIQQHMELPTMCPMLNIVCAYDELIIPRTHAIHPAADHVEWVNHNHLSVIFSQKIADMIVNYLKGWT